MTLPPENFHAMSDDFDELDVTDKESKHNISTQDVTVEPSQPRECWFEPSDCDDYFEEFISSNPKGSVDDFYSACDFLKASNTDVCEKFAKLLGNNRELRLEADKLAEALERIASYLGDAAQDVAEETLTNWRKYCGSTKGTPGDLEGK